MRNNGMNQFERDVKDYTGLSIPKFSHLRNRVKCCDCDKWFRASKYLPKEMIQEDKDADAFEAARIHPKIVCGKCGMKYWNKVDRKSEQGLKISYDGFVPDFRKMNRRRWKIKIERLRKKQYEED